MLERMENCIKSNKSGFAGKQKSNLDDLSAGEGLAALATHLTRPNTHCG